MKELDEFEEAIYTKLGRKSNWTIEEIIEKIKSAKREVEKRYEPSFD